MAPLTVLLRAIAGFIIAVLLSLTLQYAYEALSPTDWWVEFESTQTYDKFIIGTQPGVTSYSRYPRGGDVRWNDILRCDTDFDGVAEFFSNYKSRSTNRSRQQDIVGVPWVYQGDIPRVEAACTIEPNTVVMTELGRQKKEKAVSNIFYFVPNDESLIKPLGDQQ